MKICRVGSLLACLMISFFGSTRRTVADELAALSGRITDSQGLVVPGVKVDATNINTNLNYSAETNGDGLFRISEIPPGVYRVILQKTGFAQIVKPGVELHVQDVITLNFTMRLGSVNESITVSTSGLNINTTDGSVGTVIDRNFVSQLPMNGRSFNTLLQLTPGAVIAPQNARNGELGQFSINGQRTDANYFSVDGVSANFATNSFGGAQGMGGVAPAFNAIGGTSSLVSVDALQEFRVQTSSFAPEYGHQPGGQIAIETRSGTNSFHGDAFDYFRNTVLDANDWFANAAGKPRAPENQNDFGGVLGGPIKIPGSYDGHDKTFFFFSYEGLRLRQPQGQLVLVPTLAVRASAIPAAVAYLNAFPKPDANSPDLGNGVGQFTGSWSNKSTIDATSVRIDHSFGPAWRIFGRFNDSPSDSEVRIRSLSELDTTSVNTRTLTVGLTGALRSTLTNSFRANYSRQSVGTTASLDSFGGAIPPAANLLFPSPLSPSDSGANFGFANVNVDLIDGLQGRNKLSQVNILDDIGFTLGSHQLKFGADERLLRSNRSAIPAALTYLASTPQNFSGNATADVGIFSQRIGSARVSSHSFSLYGQDTWKIGRRLTITYGLRWELDPAPSGLGDTIVPAWDNVSNPATTVLAPLGTSPWRTTYGNVAPRVGVAYSLSRSGDFVVRGGIGLYYDTGSAAVGNLFGGFPFVSSVFVAPPPNLTLPRPNLNGLTPSTSIQPPYQSQLFYAMSPDLQLPRSYQWNASLEKAFAGKQSLTITYLGQVGRRLLRQQVFQIPPSNSNFSRFSFFFLEGNADTSDYHALQLQYRRPLVKRLQALVSYTWGHSLDTESGDTFFGANDQIVSPGADRGSSDFDVRQNFVGALTFDVPNARGPYLVRAISKAWSLSLVTQARTGFPINVTTSQLSALGYFGASRPDLVPGQPIWLQDSKKPGGKSLNPAAFSVPATPRQGNLPRNWIQGFGMTQLDLSVARQFNFSERWKLQFRGDMFNLANHPNLANPPGIFLGPAVTTYLQSTHMLNQALGGLNALYQVGGPRSIQLSLKLLF